MFIDRLKYIIQKLIHLRSSVVKITTFKAYCQHTLDSELKLFRLNTETEVFPVRFWGYEDKPSIKTKSPELFLAHIYNTEIIGISNVLKTRLGYVIYDMLSENKYRITDRAFIWREKCREERARPFSFLDRYFLFYYNYGKTVDKAISLVGNYSGNYYHFIFEIISKFYILERANIPDDVPIIIDNVVRRIPQFNELIGIFNKKRKLIYIDPLEICKVKDLYWPSFVHQIPPNLWDPSKAKSEDVIFNIGALVFVRDNCLQYGMADDNKIYPKNFYIARKNTNKRQYNEDEILDIAINNGYVEVHPESMTFKEQVKLFSNAESIIGPSGAAFSNIICCKEGCKILILISDRYEVTIFSNIAGLLHLDMQYLCGMPSDRNNVQTQFRINESDFRRYLENKSVF